MVENFGQLSIPTFLADLASLGGLLHVKNGELSEVSVVIEIPNMVKLRVDLYVSWTRTSLGGLNFGELSEVSFVIESLVPNNDNMV